MCSSRKRGGALMNRAVIGIVVLLLEAALELLRLIEQRRLANEYLACRWRLALAGT
jgi:hypothetical protein